MDVWRRGDWMTSCARVFAFLVETTFFVHFLSSTVTAVVSTAKSKGIFYLGDQSSFIFWAFLSSYSLLFFLWKVKGLVQFSVLSDLFSKVIFKAEKTSFSVAIPCIFKALFSVGLLYLLKTSSSVFWPYLEI